ncbi:MAG: hypothetical protein HYU46_09675 [Deltaproteobacteria bacterium]|nr:hypothetical protein [Deltaproteobacteria bacterium]
MAEKTRRQEGIIEMLRGKKSFLPLALGLIVVSLGSSVAYEVSPVTGGATVTGKIVFKGAVPTPKKLLITKDEDVCGKGAVERKEIDVTKDGGLRHVVIFLEGVSKGKPWQKPPEGFVLDQKKCAFLPYLLVMPKGAEATVLNSDQALHNIHAYELIGKASRTLFNVAQPKFKPKVTQQIAVRKGNTAVRVECDAHNWMLGWIFVADSPYAVLVEEDGSFTIDDIPPGKYKLNAWHPFLGTAEKEVQLSAGGKEQIVFEFSGK